MNLSIRGLSTYTTYGPYPPTYNQPDIVQKYHAEHHLSAILIIDQSTRQSNKNHGL